MHHVTQYIDDSTSTIAFTDTDDIELYLTTYTDILQEYYAMSKLQLNRTKTILMAISCRKTQLLTLSLKVQDETIVSQSQIKILGCIFDREASQIADLNYTLKQCYYALKKIRKVASLLTLECRANFIRAYVISRMNYMCITYCDLPKYVQTKIHKLLISSARLAFGSYGFKVKCSTIYTKTNLPSQSQLLYRAVALFGLKIMTFREPLSVCSLFNFPSRACKPIRLKDIPATAHTKKQTIC